VDAPPIVYGNVEDTESEDKEWCWPLGLEANGNHDACNKANQREEGAPDAPCTLEDKAEEKENEEDAAREQEAKGKVRVITTTREIAHYFLRSFSLMVGIPANNFLRDIIESLNTMKRPPMTERLRRKNVISKIRP
jgi:hypothetical protein